MTAYYNEHDPVAAHVLRALIADGVIASGDVDTRSIKEVQPGDVRGYAQCHFFAGGGLWSVAARLAGWPDDRSLWTGSCPCQPFSVVGQRKGVNDDRHLWPDFYRLIRAVRPTCVVGEQVAGPAGRAWFDQVADDLEANDYACRAVDLTPIAVGGSQVRQRLWFVACANGVTAMRVTESRPQYFSWEVEPPMGCVAHGVPGRMDFLRIAGNALDPRLAAQVLMALHETIVVDQLAEYVLGD